MYPLDDLHARATESTPPSVSIPASWPGLIVWAAGKWGVGAIFAAMLYPLYQDLKASNQQFVTITKANVEVLNALATKIESNGREVALAGAKTDALKELVERIEADIKYTHKGAQ